MGALTRIKHAWNAFLDREDEFRPARMEYGASYGSRPDRIRVNLNGDKTTITAIYVRMAIDAASVDIRHVRVDKENNDRYLSDVDSGLNECLTIEANVDQAASFFRQDLFWTMMNRGCIAIVPIDTKEDLLKSSSIDILSMRVGEIVQWWPRHVQIDLYNDRTGLREQVILPKKVVAIVENPLYNVMNEHNSTLQRLLRKLSLLDFVDEQSGSGKLDMIIQLPYVIKSESRRQQAEQRRKDIEFQLRGSKYGIAYTDGTEKVIQLNRPAENNLMKQVEFLMHKLYGELGITEGVMNGTADEKAMINYYNRSIAPMIKAVTEEMKRKFLTKTARTQGQSVMGFRNPFEYVPMSEFAEIADKLSRNELFSANELRGAIGFKPSTDKKADELRNSNINPIASTPEIVQGEVVTSAEDEIDPFAGINETLDEVFNELGVEG